MKLQTAGLLFFISVSLLILITLLGILSFRTLKPPASTLVTQSSTQETTPPKGIIASLKSSFQDEESVQFSSTTSEYLDNQDGTVTDLTTGLQWVKAAGEKMTYAEALKKVDSFELAGYTDWRVPTTKELYSLIDFSGIDVPPTAQTASTPFIDGSVFEFKYGDLSAGDRIIDSQWVTSTHYVSTVMNNQSCFFGVNFADGRIKCYPMGDGQFNKTYYVRYVRGPEGYAENVFTTNNNGTISDEATGLMWQQQDSNKGMDWESALNYCENLSLAGYTDWRLPTAKELHSIVDYSRSPDTTQSPALDPIFTTTTITNEAGQVDWPYFWSSTTHLNQAGSLDAMYIAFGRSLGYFKNQFMDVHGAGSQRSDPKTGSSTEYPKWGMGPQGDVQRVFNFARCVRG